MGFSRICITYSTTGALSVCSVTAKVAQIQTSIEWDGGWCPDPEQKYLLIVGKKLIGLSVF